jgi:beta-galactosidase/beta-glucuronidase
MGNQQKKLLESFALADHCCCNKRDWKACIIVHHGLHASAGKQHVVQSLLLVQATQAVIVSGSETRGSRR